jgi:bifunctional non-homologous end joining protein LigD
LRRHGPGVRLFARRGYDWTDRYPAIASAAAKLRARSSDAILLAFDLIELNGEDFRPLPLGKRKARLAQLLARVPIGIELNEHTDTDGATVFLHACKMGLEGIVSKRVTAPYRSGPSRDWIKAKSPDIPAMQLARERHW